LDNSDRYWLWGVEHSGTSRCVHCGKTQLTVLIYWVQLCLS